MKEVHDLLDEGPLVVTQTYELPVVQNLLGIRGSRASDIRTVISQQKALEQCDGYIRQHGYKVIVSGNTALAARQVTDGNDMSVAAIASLETAARYGLKVLDEKINEKDDNITTFVAVEKER